MPITAREVVTEALYLSGWVSRQFQTPTGQQIHDGLRLLNEELMMKAVELDLKPYFTATNFTGIIGQEKYFIENLVEIETLTFVWANVRYPIFPKTREQYFGSPRVNTVLTLPNTRFVERCYGGSNVYLYPFPDRTYVFELVGKFSFQNVGLDTDLTAQFDQYYLTYLRYATAKRVCDFLNVDLSPSSRQQLEACERKITDVSPTDFSIRKTSVFKTSPAVVNLAYMNLGNGWTP